MSGCLISIPILRHEEAATLRADPPVSELCVCVCMRASPKTHTVFVGVCTVTLTPLVESAINCCVTHSPALTGTPATPACLTPVDTRLPDTCGHPPA